MAALTLNALGLRAKPQADEFNLGRVLRVELVLAVALLGADAFSTRQSHRQIDQRLGIEGRELRRLELASTSRGTTLTAACWRLRTFSR